MVILFLLFGCSKPLNSLLLTEEEPKGSNCQHGGTTISHGLDLNLNGSLELNEVVEKKYVCLNEIITTTVEEAKGSNCQHGGTVISYGLDLNANGVLDPNEINQTKYACQKKSQALSKTKAEELIKQQPIFTDGTTYCDVYVGMRGPKAIHVRGKPLFSDLDWSDYKCFNPIVDEGYASYGNCIDHQYPDLYECYFVEVFANENKGVVFSGNLYIPCGTVRFSGIDNIVLKEEKEAIVYFGYNRNINNSTVNVLKDCRLTDHEQEGRNKTSVTFLQDQDGEWIISESLKERGFQR